MMDERYERRDEDDERRFTESAPREYEGRRPRAEGYYQPLRSRGVYESGRGGRERRFLDRARDEVLSWFGDQEAELRRREDEREALRRRERETVDERAWGQEPGGPPQTRGGRGHGPYSGRGPKGYQRSDERIREDVCELFCEHAGLDASELEVQVVAREVTLVGMVPSRSQKRLAEDLAETVSGVTDVHNQLRVNPTTTEPSPGGPADWRNRAA